MFLSAGVQGNSHPADSSKVCELDEGRHAVAPDSCHTGSICRYGYSTHARVLSSGLGGCLYPLRNNYYNVLGDGGYNSHLHYVVPGLAAVLWPTTTLSCHMDFGGVGFREPPCAFPPFKGVVPSQHSSILSIGPYCGLTVHQAEVLVSEPPPLGDPVDRHP